MIDEQNAGTRILIRFEAIPVIWKKMMKTYIRCGLALFLFLTLLGAQGCGTFRNVTFGAPSNFDPEDSIVQPKNDGTHNIAVRNESLKDKSRTHDVQGFDAWITHNSPMLYGGILYDYNWIVWQEYGDVSINIISALYGLLDAPFSLAGDTITGPFILLSSERYHDS